MKEKGTLESITAEGCSVRIVNAAAVTHPVKNLTEVPIQWTKKVLYVGSGYSFKIKDLQKLQVDLENTLSIQLEAYNKKQQLLQCSIVLNVDDDHSNAVREAKRAFWDISKKLQKQWDKMEQKKAAAAKVTPAAQRKHRTTYSKRPTKTFAQRLGHQQRHNLHAPHWSSDEEEELPSKDTPLPDKELPSDNDDDSEQERQFLDDDAMAQDTSADYMMETTALDNDNLENENENKEKDIDEDDSDDDEIIPSKTKSRPKKRFKRKMVVDDDSDDDEFSFSNDASVKNHHNDDAGIMTTPKPSTQRIVSPSTLVSSPMNKKSKTTATTVSSAKGKANIKSFFAPKTASSSTSVATKTTPLKMNKSKFFAKTTPPTKQENDPLRDSSDDETVKADIFSSPTPKSKKTNDDVEEEEDPVQDSDDDEELVATPLPASSSRTLARKRLAPRSYGRKSSTSETKTSSFGSSTLTLTLNSPARHRQLANAMASRSSSPPRTPSKKHPTSGMTTTTPVKKAPLPKIRGLRNLGNTCYLNSSLQCLFSIPSFVQALGKQLATTTDDDNKSNTTTAPLTKALVELYQELQPQHRPAKSPTEVKHRVDDTTSKFAGYQQRDAHEWMAHVVDQVHEELVVSTKQETQNKDSEKVTLPTDDYFRINVQVCLTCKSCGYARNKQEFYTCLSVDLPPEGEPTPQDCLKQFFAPQDVTVTCEKCQTGTKATQTLAIQEPRPKAVWLHLKRFVVQQPDPNDPTNLVVSKNKQPVQLSPTLSLEPFLAAAAAAAASKDGDTDDMDTTSTPPSSSKSYNIQSIVHHIGSTANSGHYTASGKRGTQWVSFDDSLTEETTFQTVSGSVANQKTAYMLLYSSV